MSRSAQGCKSIMSDSKSGGRKVVLVRVRPGAPVLSQRFPPSCRDPNDAVSCRVGNVVGKVIVPDTFWPVLARPARVDPAARALLTPRGASWHEMRGLFGRADRARRRDEARDHSRRREFVRRAVRDRQELERARNREFERLIAAAENGKRDTVKAATDAIERVPRARRLLRVRQVHHGRLPLG